jgi:hypothetical protein
MVGVNSSPPLVNEGMDENKIPVQAPSIPQSEQSLLELIHRERRLQNSAPPDLH